jgi:fructose-1,6-bisphosphatase/sedoheptulose 1,7-bisphosphatase-like protein
MRQRVGVLSLIGRRQWEGKGGTSDTHAHKNTLHGKKHRRINRNARKKKALLGMSRRLVFDRHGLVTRRECFFTATAFCFGGGPQPHRQKQNKQWEQTAHATNLALLRLASKRLQRPL